MLNTIFRNALWDIGTALQYNGYGGVHFAHGIFMVQRLLACIVWLAGSFQHSVSPVLWFTGSFTV